MRQRHILRLWPAPSYNEPGLLVKAGQSCGQDRREMQKSRPSSGDESVAPLPVPPNRFI